jgi:AcrR family transcriptional regulator
MAPGEKGEATRDRIVERAGQLASREGIDGITIGLLANDLGMSKSGLFAHFRSKEDMQLVILKAWVARFQERVLRPALRARRGLPRLQLLFKLWLAWLEDKSSTGGCLFIAASTELDDKDGAVRDYLVEQQKLLIDLLAELARTAVASDEMRPDVDVRQIAFDIHGVVLATHHAMRLLKDPDAATRARTAFDRLVCDAARRPSLYQAMVEEAKKHERSYFTEPAPATPSPPATPSARSTRTRGKSRPSGATQPSARSKS